VRKEGGEKKVGGERCPDGESVGAGQLTAGAPGARGRPEPPSHLLTTPLGRVDIGLGRCVVEMEAGAGWARP